MPVQVCCRVYGSVVCGCYLVYGVVIYSIGFAVVFHAVLVSHRGSESAEWQSHEYAIEPYLMAVYGFVPVDAVSHCARLAVELVQQSAYGSLCACGWSQLVHSRYEMSCAHIVKVEVVVFVSSYFAIGCDHRVDIVLAIASDVITAISKVCVEDGFKFDAHHITPFGF